MRNHIYKESLLALTLSTVIFKSLIFDVMTCDLLQEVLAHHHQQVTSILLQ